MKVIKRDGKLQDFTITKIADAVNKAFISCDVDITKDRQDVILQYILRKLGTPAYANIPIEDIQNTVEETLMELGYYDVAKAYILYREEHNRIRKFTKEKKDFIANFSKSSNTANATIDDNSNVTNHNIAVLNAEIHKPDNQHTNMDIWKTKLVELFPEISVKQMDKDFSTIMYPHDASSQVGMPYCAAVSLYPMLVDGLAPLGCLSTKPKNLDSFCGIFVNLVFKLASEFKGAIATPAFFVCMSWFCRKKWGGIIEDWDEKQLIQHFQQITYSLNQPVGRLSQSIFWNLSFFDRSFFNSMYGKFRFPDNTEPTYEEVDYLQRLYLTWLNEERLKCMLTFPVTTCALIFKDGKYEDENFFKYICKEYSKGNSFFTYISETADSLSSCCRLRNKISTNEFNFTNGNVGEMTGSKNVITLDINRIVQDYSKEFKTFDSEGFKSYFIEILNRVYKYHVAYNDILHDFYNANLYDSYRAGYINLDRQYLTIGVNGITAAADFLGIESNNNEMYKSFISLILGTIKEQNIMHKTKTTMFNTELTP